MSLGSRCRRCCVPPHQPSQLRLGSAGFYGRNYVLIPKSPLPEHRDAGRRQPWPCRNIATKTISVRIFDLLAREQTVSALLWHSGSSTSNLASSRCSCSLHFGFRSENVSPSVECHPETFCYAFLRRFCLGKQPVPHAFDVIGDHFTRCFSTSAQAHTAFFSCAASRASGCMAT